MKHSHPENSKIKNKENGSSATQNELKRITVEDNSSANVNFN